MILRHVRLMEGKGQKAFPIYCRLDGCTQTYLHLELYARYSTSSLEARHLRKSLER